MFKKITGILALAVALVFTAQAAFAALNAVGPTNQQNGFPTWYQDSNGIAVELGLDPALNLFDPPIPGNAFSQQIGFGAEGFYWIAETLFDLDELGNGVFYRANLEYAWANELPADGDQFTFVRLRFRIDAPVAGTYIVTHPYGVDVFEAAAPGIRAINETIDVGGVTPNFTAALGGRVGPFLTAVNPAPPAGFLGGGVAVSATVQGSPFGTNFVRVQGPGGIDVTSNLFMVSGKIFIGHVNTPLTVDRVTYKRSAHDSVDVIATSTPNATVFIEGLTTPPAAAAMTGDGTGKFYRHVHPTVAVLPPTITVRADDDPLNDIILPTGVIKNLVDQVTISKAEYDVNARTLTINAASGDEVALPAPVLTAVGFGSLASGALTTPPNVIVPPASVTVTSSLGGSDTRNVDIVEIAPPPANIPPTAGDDSANTVVGIAVTINVLANDVDIDGTINAGTLTITVSPASGTAIKNTDNTITYTPGVVTGAVSFSYIVQDNGGAVSNTAVVSINVAEPAPAPNIPPVANPDTANTNQNTPVLINLIANDTDADGINPASVTIVTQPVSGALVNNGDGTVTYTPTAGFFGADSFTYTVRDSSLPAPGVISNVATVSITVARVEAITVTTALFRRIGARWIVSGTGSIPGSVITVSIEGGAQVGTATVSTLGIWSVALRNSTIIPVAGDTLRVDSTGGAVLHNVPLTIRD